eukprot:CAMPEP_0194183946 /NCGR_PEP_ID=MMETSP0154-20130528/34938_1 /TAXON_ID=1049557 /ORGANISM="Thalassiothrix antarctica, Strain L6-D1" /LENGTH=87 /DNA_ID=CAMNT_0038901233 /DNA_START=1 /DNA_END=261 /DNA_ORIENTATION=+
MLPPSWSYELKAEVMNRVIVEYQTWTTWNDMFRMLQRYKDREGDCNVPGKYKENEINLGRWLGEQRQKYKKRKLDPVYEKRLEEIGV